MIHQLYLSVSKQTKFFCTPTKVALESTVEFIHTTDYSHTPKITEGMSLINALQALGVFGWKIASTILTPSPEPNEIHFLLILERPSTR